MPDASSCSLVYALSTVLVWGFVLSCAVLLQGKGIPPLAIYTGFPFPGLLHKVAQPHALPGSA